MQKDTQNWDALRQKPVSLRFPIRLEPSRSSCAPCSAEHHDNTSSVTSPENSLVKGKEFYEQKDNGKMEPRISLPHHHLIYQRRPYLHYNTPQERGSVAEHRLWGSICLETNPHNGPCEDTTTFTHPTSRGEWGPWSSVEIWKKSALSSATQREVLRCQVSSSLREGLRAQAQTTARRETIPGSLTSEPPY